MEVYLKLFKAKDGWLKRIDKYSDYDREFVIFVQHNTRPNLTLKVLAIFMIDWYEEELLESKDAYYSQTSKGLYDQIWHHPSKLAKGCIWLSSVTSTRLGIYQIYGRSLDFVSH